jgi:hypothetical protein
LSRYESETEFGSILITQQHVSAEEYARREPGPIPVCVVRCPLCCFFLICDVAPVLR